MLLCAQRDCDAALACGAEEAGTASRRRRAAAPRRPGGDRFLEMGMELSPVRRRLIFLYGCICGVGLGVDSIGAHASF
jgi:hypothetical protein